MSRKRPESGQRPVEELVDRLEDMDIDYPEGEVIRVPERISGTAFFPGGYGLWQGEGPDGPFPHGGVMVLGQDFHSERNYRKSYSVGHELDTPTWKHLPEILKRASIRLEECFFTNAYMGLRTDCRSTGRSPGANNRRFRQQCESFFLEKQLPTQQPGLILALGLEVVKFIASLSPNLAEWKGRCTWGDLDAVGPLKHGVHFDPTSARATVVAALVHPSLRWPNFAKSPELRRYRGRSGDDAELAMLHEAVSIFRKGER